MLKSPLGTLLVVLAFPVCVFSQDLDSLLKMSAFTEESELQKQLNKNVTVSSSKALTSRETPGIISVVTSQEIQNAGARDITDVLRLVPGFDIGQDLQFVMGIGLRGNWANEGKVLVMMDGQPFNELLYQTVAIGNRFPVDAIERIEIIRGPGSAVYGGSAEYGVINIITKAAESLNGIAVYGTGGFHADATGRKNAGVMIAKRNTNFGWDFSAFKGKGIVSDNSQYQDLYQDSDVQNLAKTTYSDPMNLNLGLKYKSLAVRTMYDKFETGDPFSFVSYKSFFADIKYGIKVSDKFRVTPQFKYYDQTPWTYGTKGFSDPDFEVHAKRMIGQVEAMYDISRKVNVTAGGLYFQDKSDYATVLETFSGDPNLKLSNYALFAQALMKHRLANATIGFRYEKNNRYGAAFVPRLALTKKIENFHFKVLFSQAFRAPSLQNINIALGGKIKPEKSNVFEIELGYQFTPEMLLAVNAFNIATRNVMVYGSEGTGNEFQEWYENSAKSGTNGIEVVYSIRKKSWYANLTYSYSHAISGNTVSVYEVPQTAKHFAGFPASKITLNTAVNLTAKLTFNPSFIYGGKRYAYTTVDDNGDSVSEELDAYLLTNAFFNYRDVVKGLTLGVGVYDLFNERAPIAQAYNGGYAPIPGRSREYVIKLSYQLNFSK
jgi:outer membrane receptor for ferrienterochelin and colicin